MWGHTLQRPPSLLQICLWKNNNCNISKLVLMLHVLNTGNEAATYEPTQVVCVCVWDCPFEKSNFIQNWGVDIFRIPVSKVVELWCKPNVRSEFILLNTMVFQSSRAFQPCRTLILGTNQRAGTNSISSQEHIAHECQLRNVNSTQCSQWQVLEEILNTHHIAWMLFQLRLQWLDG